MRKRIGWIAFMAFVLLIGLQCGTSDNTPSIPVLDPPLTASTPGISGDNYLWGIWQFSIEKSTGEVVITQLRQGDLALNVLGFLEPPALSNLSIDFNTLNIDPPNLYVGVDVILKHPLVTPEGVFDGFDVRGVVIGPAVTNADGWTAMMNPDDFSGEPFGYMDGLLGAPNSFAGYKGDWFGYKYYCDGLGLTDDYGTYYSDEANLLTRGIFEEGETNVRHFDIDFDVGGEYGEFLIFNYAVVASYNWPGGEPPYDLEDFDISTANVAEPFCGRFFNVENGLGQDPTGKLCGSFSADFEVWDWQGLDDLDVTLQCDALMDLAPITTFEAGTSRSGIVHFVDVPVDGGYVMVGDHTYVWAVCTDTSETFGSSWFMNLLGTGNPRYNDPVFTTFSYWAEVPLNTAPLAAAEADILEPALDEEVTFNAANTFDQQSPITELTFEWDLDGDLAYDDGTGIIVNYTYTVEGEYDVDVLVTDPCGATDTLDEKLTISVTLCGAADAHSDNNKTINISNFSIIPRPWGSGNQPRFSLAFLTEGPYAGQAVAHAGPNTLGTFDADADGDVTGNILCKLRPYYYLSGSGPATTPNIPILIDVCPQGGYILVVTDTRYFTAGQTVHLHKLEAYAPDGSGVVFSIRNDIPPSVINGVCALDCDDNGDIWLVGYYYLGRYFLVRIPYTGGNPPWDTDFNNYDGYDITSLFIDENDIIIDMAIDYADQRIYILHTGNGTGKLSAYDFSTGPPIYDATHSVNPVFTDPMDVATDVYMGYWLGVHKYYGGVEIDHVDADAEKCRIVVYSRVDTASGSVPRVVRFNHLTEEMDSNDGTLALPCFSINNDTSDSVRHMIFPATNPLAKLWDTPATW